MWEDDFDEEDFDEENYCYQITDAFIFYVYNNISEGLRKKVGGLGIEKIFQYEKQFMDESKKLLEYGVQSGEEFEEDMVYYIQRNLSVKLILTIEEVTEILRVEEEYYLEDDYPEYDDEEFDENDDDEYDVDYFLEEAAYLHYVAKDYGKAKVNYLRAFEIVELSDVEAIAFIKESLEDLKNPSNQIVDYLKSYNEESDELRYCTNYVRFYLERNKPDMAMSYLDLLLDYCLIDENKSILAQLLFYCFANLYDEYPDAKRKLEMLIAEWVVCDNCDFSFNIQKAKEDEHPEIDKVIEFATKLCNF